MAGISSVGALLRRLGYREQVALAVLVGLAIRVALAVSDDVITNDASAYLRSGQSLWAGDGFRREGHPELHFPPLYPAVLGGLDRLWATRQRAMVAATLVASTAVLLLVASLARRLGGDRAGVAAVWIAALAAGLTDVPVTSGSGNEVVFVLLVLAAIRLALLAHDRQGGARQLAALGAGAMLGAPTSPGPRGCSTRAVVAAILLAPIVVRAARDRRSRLLAVASMTAGLLVFLVPYASYLHTNTGSWELTAKTNDVVDRAWQGRRRPRPPSARCRDLRAGRRRGVVREPAAPASPPWSARTSTATGSIVATNVRQLVDGGRRPRRARATWARAGRSSPSRQPARRVGRVAAAPTTRACGSSSPCWPCRRSPPWPSSCRRAT